MFKSDKPVELKVNASLDSTDRSKFPEQYYSETASEGPVELVFDEDDVRLSPPKRSQTPSHGESQKLTLSHEFPCHHTHLIVSVSMPEHFKFASPKPLRPQLSPLVSSGFDLNGAAESLVPMPSVTHAQPVDYLTEQVIAGASSVEDILNFVEAYDLIRGLIELIDDARKAEQCSSYGEMHGLMESLQNLFQLIKSLEGKIIRKHAISAMDLYVIRHNIIQVGRDQIFKEDDAFIQKLIIRIKNIIMPITQYFSFAFQEDCTHFFQTMMTFDCHQASTFYRDYPEFWTSDIIENRHARNPEGYKKLSISELKRMLKSQSAKSVTLMLAYWDRYKEVFKHAGRVNDVQKKQFQHMTVLLKQWYDIMKNHVTTCDIHVAHERSLIEMIYIHAKKIMMTMVSSASDFFKMVCAFKDIQALFQIGCNIPAMHQQLYMLRIDQKRSRWEEASAMIAVAGSSVFSELQLSVFLDFHHVYYQVNRPFLPTIVSESSLMPIALTQKGYALQSEALTESRMIVFSPRGSCSASHHTAPSDPLSSFSNKVWL